MASSPFTSTTNKLLAALPADVLAQLLPKFSRVSLANRQVLFAPEQPIEAVFFIESGMTSMVLHLEEGIQAEIGIVSREGMAGLPLVFGLETGFTESFMQLSGTGLRMPAAAFRRE